MSADFSVHFGNHFEPAGQGGTLLSVCLRAVAVIGRLAETKGRCHAVAKSVTKSWDFFLKKCYFYKWWIFEEVHRTILKILWIPNSYNLLVIVSTEVFHEVEFFIQNQNKPQCYPRICRGLHLLVQHIWSHLRLMSKFLRFLSYS